jgi:hypothetical protein
MPDFRARVHRGETLSLPASVRHRQLARMSPAGLKAISRRLAPDGVICANNMGDIFRRNSFSLGLHVVQGPESGGRCKGGDEFVRSGVTPDRDVRGQTTRRCR